MTVITWGGEIPLEDIGRPIIDAWSLTWHGQEAVLWLSRSAEALDHRQVLQHAIERTEAEIEELKAQRPVRPGRHPRTRPRTVPRPGCRARDARGHRDDLAGQHPAARRQARHQGVTR